MNGSARLLLLASLVTAIAVAFACGGLPDGERDLLDAGPSDAARPDASIPDSGALDAGPFADAGMEPDAGEPIDAGIVDAGEPPDAGDEDAGGADDASVSPLDGGPIDDAGSEIDAGSPVAEDAGLADAGEPDAGFADAGDYDAGFADAGGIDAGPAVLVDLTPAQLLAMLQGLPQGACPASKGFVMIDVHVPYAGRIPCTDTSITYTDVDALAAYIGPDLNTPVVLTCLAGGMSRSAGNQLIARGYRNVSQLAGGMLAWQAAGYPLAP